MKNPVLDTFKKAYKSKNFVLSQLAELTNITEDRLGKKLNGQGGITGREIIALRDAIDPRMPTWKLFPEIYKHGRSSGVEEGVSA